MESKAPFPTIPRSPHKRKESEKTQKIEIKQKEEKKDTKHVQTNVKTTTTGPSAPTTAARDSLHHFTATTRKC
jgi:hypothetical protein